jgi:hypothetical protein
LTLIKEFVVVSQFTHNKLALIANGESPADANKGIVALNKVPELCIYNKLSNEILMKEDINLFDPIFSELHYSIASYSKYDGNSFCYNPDTMVKIQPITIIDRLDYLLIKKR